MAWCRGFRALTFMNREKIIGAIGTNYLKGGLSMVWVADKFCLLDNLEDSNGNEWFSGMLPRLRFPLKVTFTVTVFCREGRISLRIQQKDYLLEAGTVLVIFGGQILENVEVLNESKVIIVAIDSEYIMTEIRGQHGRSLRQWVMHNQEPALVRIDQDSADNYERLCQSLKFIVRNSDQDTADGVLSGFTYIFASLLLRWRREYVTDEPDPSAGHARGLDYSREREALVRFQTDIHNFSRKDRTVGFYARRQCVSEKHFSRLIKKASGKKPLDIIREYVILDAKSLLLSGKYSVKQVAEMLGFQNHSFFTRFFRNSTGKTPGQFVKED